MSSRTSSDTRSRSPLDINSRSPLSRKSRSPTGRKSRSPSGRRSRSTSGRKRHSPSSRKSGSPSTEQNTTTSGRKHRTRKRSDQQEESPPGYGSSVSVYGSASESTIAFGSPSRERISKSIICNLNLPVARVKSMIKVNLNNQ